MKVEYNRLINIQKNVSGSSFLIGYSSRRNQPYVRLVNKYQTVFRNDDIKKCINMAIEYIEKNKKLKGVTETLH